MNRKHTAGHDIDAETDALRSGLRSRADLVTITPPPIAAVRQRAQKRRIRRGAFQGLSGVVATCAVAAGVFAWSPGRDPVSGPVPGNTNKPTLARTAMSPSPTPPTPTTGTTTAPPAPPSTSRAASTSAFLLAADLGTGWTESDDTSMVRNVLTLAGSQCENSGAYKAQVPVAPTLNKAYNYSAPAKQTIALFEAVYTFAPGAGSTVMAKARASLQNGCGSPDIKLLTSPPTVADEAIVYTAGGDSRNVLVRSGDRVASMVVNTVPAGPEGTAWINHVAQQMAIRLTAG